MVRRPDLTAVISVDEFGEASALISGAACTSERVVDRAGAWARLVEMATLADRSLLVHTVDEHGRAHRDVVDPAPAPDDVVDQVAEPAVPACPPTPASDPDAAPATPVARETRAVKAHDGATDVAAREALTSRPEPVESEAARAATVEAGRRDGRARSGGGHGTSQRVSPPALAGMAVGLVFIGVLLLTTGDLDSDDAAAADPRTSAPFAAPIAPPAGWTQTAQWRADLASGTLPAVTSTGLVAVATSDGKITVAEPGSGTTLWSASVRGAGTPMAIRLDGSDAVAWQRPGELVVWTFGGDVRRIDIPDSATATHAGGRLLVRDARQPGQVHVLTAEGLRDVSVPANTSAMGANVHHVIATDGRSMLWRRPIAGGDAERITLDGPKGMTVRRWAGMAGVTVTVVWDRPGDPAPGRDVVVITYDVRSGKQLAAASATWADVETAEPHAEAVWQPSMVTLGPVVLPTTNGIDPIGVPGATWTGHHDDDVWGSRGVTGLHVTRHGDVEKATTAVPIGIGAGETAIVVDGGTAYGLQPDDAGAIVQSHAGA